MRVRVRKSTPRNKHHEKFVRAFPSRYRRLRTTAAARFSAVQPADGSIPRCHEDRVRRSAAVERPCLPAARRGDAVHPVAHSRGGPDRAGATRTAGRALVSDAGAGFVVTISSGNFNLWSRAVLVPFSRGLNSEMRRDPSSPSAYKGELLHPAAPYGSPSISLHPR